MNTPKPYSDETRNLIDRMSAANMRRKWWLDAQAIRRELETVFDIAELKMPAHIRFCSDPNDADFWEAFDRCGESQPLIKARELIDQVRTRYHDEPSVERAWARWASQPSRAARAAFLIPESCAIDYDFDRLIAMCEYFESGHAITVNEARAGAILYGYLKLRELGVGWIAQDERSSHLLIAPIIRLDDAYELHDDGGPAVEWANGDQDHYLHGIPDIERMLTEFRRSGSI